MQSKLEQLREEGDISFGRVHGSVPETDSAKQKEPDKPFTKEDFDAALKRVSQKKN